MKKKFLGLMTGILCLSGLAGCTNGIEKEYTMNIKEEPIVARLVEDEEKEVLVAHCKRGGSLLNYYIALPEIEEGFEIPEHLTAKDTSKTVKYFIIKDGKSEKVSDYGYVFLKWGEK